MEKNVALANNDGAMNGEEGTDREKRGRKRRPLSAYFGKVQKFELIEVEQLSDEVLKRMNKTQPDADERHKAWVAAEFRYPLRSLLIKAGHNSTYFALLSIVVVAGGFATSGIAVAGGAGEGSSAAWVVFAIGLIVALAGGIAQIFRFGVRSNARRALALNLREEGWNFVYKEGDYTNDADALRKFRARVNEIQRRIAEVASIDSEAQPAAPSGTDQKPGNTAQVQPGKDDQGKTPGVTVTEAGGDNAR